MDTAVIWSALSKRSLTIRSPLSTATVVKRAEGCTSLNGATAVNVSGSVFDIFCDTIWGYYDILFISYTPDFQTCIEECVRWNTNNVNHCVGVFWVCQQYGPLGVNGGYECFYTWDMVDGSNSSASDTDSVDCRALCN